MFVDISAILVLFCPVIGLPVGLIGIFRDRADWRSYIFCMAVFVGCVAYCYHPIVGSDISTYYELIGDYGRMTFRQALTVDNAYAGLHALNIFFWAIGRVGDARIAQGFTTFVVYYIAYYVTCAMAEDMKVSRRHLLCYLLFITMALNFSAILNNIRNIFAFSVVGLAIFRDAYQKKRNIWTLLLYVIGATFHNTAIVVILLRFFVGAKGKRLIILCMLLLMMNAGITYLYEHYYNRISSGSAAGVWVRKFLIRAYQYYHDTGSEWSVKAAKSGQRIFQRIFYMAIMFGMGAMGLAANRKKAAPANDGTRWHAVAAFSMFGVALSISCINMVMPEYWRFAMLALSFGAPIYFSLVNELPKKGTVYIMIHLAGLVTGAACMLLWMWNIAVNGDVAGIILEPFISGPFVILVKDLISPLINLPI